MEVITSHIQADFDAFASMIAAKKLYPGAILVFPGAQEKNLRDYLMRASPPVTSGISKLKSISLDEVDRLIIVDTRQLSRIGGFSRLIGKKGVEVIIYDHHPPAGDDIKNAHETSAEYGSNVTLMVDILRKRRIKPTAEEATIMAMGIFEDTGSLLFPSTRPEDCIALAKLLQWGANMKAVSQTLLRELSPEQVDILDQLIKNAYIFHVGGIDVLFTRSESSTYVEDFAMLVHKLRGMFEADAMFALGRMGERIYLVARSTVPQINASEVASYFGGGGHPTAAAASIKDSSLDKAESTLVNIIKKETRPRITARDIMTFPIITLNMDATIDEASETLNRYNINAAIVQSKDERVIGVITRQVVSRAQGHNLGAAKIDDYMIRDIKFIRPDAPVWEIRTLIIDGNQRLLPVVDERKPIGVITRTDLMRIMHEKMTRVEGLDYRSSQKKNIQSLLEERLPKDMYSMLQQAGELAASMEYNIYLVGGIVRDMLLRIDNLDIDLVVEGNGIAFAKTFALSMGARCAMHEKYKTAVITLQDGTHIDVATARLEYYKHPGGYPIVEESTLKLDLYRRDFTINTMAISLNPQRFGELIDFFGAQRDIKEKRLRVLHALSFVEDPSRILRAVRFEKRYGFSLGKQTLSLVHAAVKSGLLGNIPGRRISHEIRQILSEDDPLQSLDRLRELGVLTAIHPDLVFNAAIRENFIRVRQTISWFNLLYTHEAYRTWLIYLLALVDHMKPKMIIAICSRLGLSDVNIRNILAAKAKVDTVLKELTGNNRKKPPSSVVNTFEKVRLEEILFAMSKAKSAYVKEMISSYITTWRSYMPPVKGKDLIAIGFKKGKHLGNSLRLIRDKGLNGEIRDFSQAIAFARKLLDEQSLKASKG